MSKAHKQHCDCYKYPAMHDEHRVCVNYDLHNNQPCSEWHTRSIEVKKGSQYGDQVHG